LQKNELLGLHIQADDRDLFLIPTILAAQITRADMRGKEASAKIQLLIFQECREILNDQFRQFYQV
jgi:hypothetical protein